MKKLILLVAAIAFSFGVQAQEKTMPNKTHLMMQNGKMWIMKDGKSSEMTDDATLNEGTTVTVSGKVTMKDGSTKILANGESIDMDGMVAKQSTKTTTKKSKMK